jgi:HEPN domain-containing protein
MVTIRDLRKIAKARLQDAKVLFQSRRYDGATYLCGYAVEIALKARICKTLKWKGYPSTKAEFEGYKSFRTHNLDKLLHLSGYEKIKLNLLAEWSFVVNLWSTSARYQPIGTVSRKDAQSMISATEKLLRSV